jgi:predicted PhzF superfamily epimerase YddE/YHI9
LTRYSFYTADVFTDHLFGGNPLAVLPDVRGLTDDQMQQVARMFAPAMGIAEDPATGAAAALLRAAGYDLLLLEMSEFEKMDGGLSCLSLRF